MANLDERIMKMCPFTCPPSDDMSVVRGAGDGRTVIRRYKTIETLHMMIVICVLPARRMGIGTLVRANVVVTPF